MATIDMAAGRAEKAAEKQTAVETLRDWIRTKAAAAGAGNLVRWGVLEFTVAKAAAAPGYSGVYDSYPINATFPNDISTTLTPVVETGDTTSASASVINIGTTTGLTVGMVVTGAGIPVNTTILTVDSGTAITLSANATATAAGVSLTFTAIWSSVAGDNVQENRRNDGFDTGTRVDIAIADGSLGGISHTIFVVDQDMLARDIVDTNSRELSRIMRKKILYARVKDILSYASAPEKFPGFVF